MIQGKEIRIGNYLKDRSGKILRVDFIEYVENGFDTKFGQKMFIEGQEVHAMTEYSDYANPIELSGEWLEKLGFVKTDDYGDIIYYEPKDRGNRNYYICFDHGKISFGLIVFGNCTNLLYDDANLQFVHQFQNLYYALTGVELSASQGCQGNEANTLLYTVRVICWDGIEYTREATKDEIDTQRKNGYVKEDGYSGITFDFRSSHGV